LKEKKDKDTATGGGIGRRSRGGDSHVAGGFSGKHGLMSLMCFGETGGECRFESCPVAEGGEGC